ELLAEDLDGRADLVEAHAGVEQALDDLELDDVQERVPTLGTRALGVLERGLQEVGARPVVELAIGDPHQATDLGGAVPHLSLEVDHRPAALVGASTGWAVVTGMEPPASLQGGNSARSAT